MEVKKFTSQLNQNQLYENYLLINQSGMQVILSNLGAGIRSIKIPDYKGEIKEVSVCPLEELYPNLFYGKTVGRTAGRIKNAQFTIDNRTAFLERNNFGRDNLHGGRNGLHKQMFNTEIIEQQNYVDVVFKYFSPDQENGYFGNVNIKVTYRIFENENTIRIIFEGTTDIKTLLNLTNHCYFNLSGNPFHPIFDHELYLNSSYYGVLSKNLICEDIAKVNQEMDFRTPHQIGKFIKASSLHQYTNGYDHPFFLDQSGLNFLAGYLYSPTTHIKLEVRTTYPCLVLFCSDESSRPMIKDGVDYSKISTCCLECQFHPDGIHALKERNGVFDSSCPYHEETEFKFLIERKED